MLKPQKHANKVERLTYNPKLKKILPYNPTYVFTVHHYRAKYKELYLCRVIWKKLL